MPGAGATPRKRQVHWTAQALDDLAHWDRNDRRIARRIRQLVEHIQQQPFAGIGKPEPLRYEWSGYWSRRITKEPPGVSGGGRHGLHRAVPLPPRMIRAQRLVDTRGRYAKPASHIVKA